MSVPLEELMHDATAIADQLRRLRQMHEQKAHAGGEVHALEEQLTRTWSAIRVARSASGLGSIEPRHRPKWD